MEVSRLSGFDVARMPGRYTSTSLRDDSFDLETVLSSIINIDSQFYDVSSVAESTGLLPCSQDLASEPCSEPDGSSPYFFKNSGTVVPRTHLVAPRRTCHTLRVSYVVMILSRTGF
jgi:hypothetical protein